MSKRIAGYAIHRGGDRYTGLFETEEDARLTARHYDDMPVVTIFDDGSVRTDRDWWICPLCGFDAKTFEPRAESQPGAIRWHMALHEQGRLA